MVRSGIFQGVRRRLDLCLTGRPRGLLAAIFVTGLLTPIPTLQAQDKLQGTMDRKVLQSSPSSGRFFNNRGSAVGRTETRNGTSRIYESSGRSLGSIQNRGSSARLYAPSGSLQGRSETRGSQTRFYDSSGRSLGTSQTSGNSTRFYGPSGTFQGRAETRNGTTRYYDSSGRALGSKK